MSSNNEPAPGEPEKSHAARVAIVEDNLEIAGLYAMLVEALHMRVSFMASDGEEAVRVFRAADDVPDIILIDHRMPLKSGLEAMKEMLATCPAARFIIISADEGMEDAAMAAGAKAFLRKPASLKDISETIIKVLNND